MLDDEHVFGILASSVEEVWTVGTGRTIRRWDGKAWTTLNGSERGSLYDLCALDENDIWAVGDKKLILRTRTR